MLERLKKLTGEAAKECFEGGNVHEVFLKYMQRAVAPELIENELTKKIGEQLEEIAELKRKNEEQSVIDNEIVRASIDGRGPMSWVQQHRKLEQIEKFLASDDDEDSDVVSKIMVLMKENKDDA